VRGEERARLRWRSRAKMITQNMAVMRPAEDAPERVMDERRMPLRAHQSECYLERMNGRLMRSVVESSGGSGEVGGQWVVGCGLWAASTVVR
jgi:hypothetical protein